jgi:thioredoxin-related protein
MKPLSLVLIFVLIATHGRCEEFISPKEIQAYHPNDPTQVLGTFQPGTTLEVDEANVANGLVPVTFKAPDGTTVKALCRVEDTKDPAPPTPTPASADTTKAPAAAPQTDTSRWITDHPKALEIAKAENKLVVMNFTGSDWCGWCIKLDKEVFSQRKFKDYAAKNLVLLKLDFPQSKSQSTSEKKQNKQLAEEYSIKGYPSVIVLSSDGKKVGKLGYMEGGPDAFIQRLETLRGK